MGEIELEADSRIDDEDLIINSTNSFEYDVGAASSCPHFEETTQKNEEQNIKKILNWQYEYKQSENIPTKTSVSKIKQ